MFSLYCETTQVLVGRCWGFGGLGVAGGGGRVRIVDISLLWGLMTACIDVNKSLPLCLLCQGAYCSLKLKAGSNQLQAAHTVTLPM